MEHTLPSFLTFFPAPSLHRKRQQNANSSVLYTLRYTQSCYIDESASFGVTLLRREFDAQEIGSRSPNFPKQHPARPHFGLLIIL
jgi:hypothetical protein